MFFSLTACQPTKETIDSNEPLKPNLSGSALEVAIENYVFFADLYDNESAGEFLKMLPLTMEMNELNGNEKYYYLSNALPENHQRVDKITDGDIMLYGSSCLVLFYESFETSYSYTSIGQIKNKENLKTALSKDSTVTFRLAQKR